MSQARLESYNVKTTERGKMKFQPVISWFNRNFKSRFSIRVEFAAAFFLFLRNTNSA